MRPSSEPRTALDLFQSSDWKRIPLELTLYAVQKVNRLQWRTSQGLPRGLLPQDLAMNAIQKTLEGLLAPESTGRGIRKWDPQKEPDLFLYLRSVVDSDVSSLVNLDEHKFTNYSANVTEDEASQRLERAIDAETATDWKQSRSFSAEPEQALLQREDSNSHLSLYERIMNQLDIECSQDANEKVVLQAMRDLIEEDEDEIKPASLVKRTGLPPEEVRNAKRRIERRTRLIRGRLTREAENAALSLRGDSYEVQPHVG